MSAAANGYLDIVQWLASNGADVNAVDREDNSVLDVAVGKGEGKGKVEVRRQRFAFEASFPLFPSPPNHILLPPSPLRPSSSSPRLINPPVMGRQRDSG